MQDREPILREHIWSLPRRPAGLPDLLSRNRDDVLVLREPYGERARPFLLATMALAASFALGWAGALHWSEVANLIGIDQIAQKDAHSPSVAAAKPGGRTESVRKAASASDSRNAAPATVGSIPKPSAVAASAVFASQASSNPVAMAAKPSMAPAPETKPTTIPGWTVVEVRDGTAVLEGPEGIKMAARGDTIPGIGRIDSIVRWGNRWIVATAHGLIATQ
jgi:hypothetical protein